MAATARITLAAALGTLTDTANTLSDTVKTVGLGVGMVNAFVSKEVLYRTAVEQVQLVARADNHLDVTALFELANNRGTHHSAMTGDKNTLFCHSQDSSAMATS